METTDREGTAMFGEIGDSGYLKIDNENDRAEVAAILYRNRYTVSTKRRKKNGKTYEYYVFYEMKSVEVGDEGESK